MVLALVVAMVTSLSWMLNWTSRATSRPVWGGRAFGNGIPQATWDDGKLLSSRGEWADACDDDGDSK